MGKIIMETQYFPTIAFFSLMKNAEEFIIEAHENYIKRSFRNRCIILGSQGPLPLSVPLKKGKNQQMPIRAVQIDYSSSWAKNHWRSIKSCYGKSPYFAFYADQVKELLDSQYKYLFELNQHIIEWLREVISMQSNYMLSAEFEEHPNGCKDFRNLFNPRDYQSQKDGFDFLNYDQVFSANGLFYKNLSFLDLLFCLGPESIIYLKNVYRNN